MRKIILCFTCLAIFQGIAHSQAPDTLQCDYPDRDTIEAEFLPWFGNNDYLENLLDSIGYPPEGTSARIVGSDRVWYHIPVKLWVYRSSAGIGGPTLGQLQAYIDNLNNFYNVVNDTRIGFYLKCDIGYIDDDDHLVINTHTEAWNLIQSHKEKGAINIHVANELKDAIGIHYRARFFGVDGIFLNRETYTNNDFSGTIAHEVGHYLELDHTHQYANRGKCRKEPVSRTRTWPFFRFCPFGGGGPTNERICEATGDFLRDTPADPDLSANNSCNYILTGLTDPWNDSYAAPPAGSPFPDPDNLMSYNGDRSCRTGFSRLQIAVMLYSIVRGKSKNNRAAWENAKGIYDEYEFDNFSEIARPISIGEIQERTFHQQILTEDFGGNPIWSQCDVDWVRFTAPCNMSLELFTEALPGYSGNSAANTRLTLFNFSLTQLAQNDDISGANKFSSITYNFVSGQEYFIRVENISPGTTTRYYRLKLGRFSIAGPDKLCTTASYTIPNLPSDATVIWSVSSSGVAVPSPLSGATTTLTRVSSGTVTLTASVSNACGAAPVIFTKDIIIQSPANYPLFRDLDLNNFDCSSLTLFSNEFATYEQVVWSTTNGLLIDGNPSPYTKNGGRAVISAPLGNDGFVTAVSLDGCKEAAFHFCPCPEWPGNPQITWQWSSPAPGEPLQAYVSPEHPDAYKYIWYVNDQIIQEDASSYLSAYTYPCSWESDLKVIAVTYCGYSVPVNGGAYSPLCNGYRGAYNNIIAPNPARNQINIATANNENKPGKVNIFFTSIVIYDGWGVIKKRLHYAKGTQQAQISVSDLRPGTYIVEITDGKNNVERQRLLIQK